LVLILFVFILLALSLFNGVFYHIPKNYSSLIVYVVDFDGQVAPYQGGTPLVGPSCRPSDGTNSQTRRTTPRVHNKATVRLQQRPNSSTTGYLRFQSPRRYNHQRQRNHTSPTSIRPRQRYLRPQWSSPSHLRISTRPEHHPNIRGLPTDRPRKKRNLPIRFSMGSNSHAEQHNPP